MQQNNNFKLIMENWRQFKRRGVVEQLDSDSPGRTVPVGEDDHMDEAVLDGPANGAPGNGKWSSNSWLIYPDVASAAIGGLHIELEVATPDGNAEGRKPHYRAVVVVATENEQQGFRQMLQHFDWHESLTDDLNEETVVFPTVFKDIHDELQELRADFETPNSDAYAEALATPLGVWLKPKVEQDNVTVLDRFNSIKNIKLQSGFKWALRGQSGDTESRPAGGLKGAPEGPPSRAVAGTVAAGLEGAPQPAGGDAADVINKVKNGTWREGGKSFKDADPNVIQMIWELQKLIGVTPDGVFGNETARAIRKKYHGS